MPLLKPFLLLFREVSFILKTMTKQQALCSVCNIVIKEVTLPKRQITVIKAIRALELVNEMIHFKSCYGRQRNSKSSWHISVVLECAKL